MRPIHHSVIFALLLLSGISCIAQVSPPHRSNLFYTQVMLEYPAVKGAARYMIKVYRTGPAGKELVYEAADSTKAHLVTRTLKFGSSYEWTSEALDKNGKNISRTGPYAFSTVKHFLADSTMYIADQRRYDSARCQPGLIIMDNNMIIDRAGNPVFVLDDMRSYGRNFSQTRDGHFLVLDSAVIREVDLENRKIWVSPLLHSKNFRIHEYHHDMIKLRNGNYLCIVHKKRISTPFPTEISAIIEVTPSNEIVWDWSEEDYFSPDTTVFNGSHMNGLFLDEGENILYVSARDLNAVIKIERSTKKALYSIGYSLNGDVPYYEQSIFKEQHRPVKLRNGNLLLLNNNTNTGVPTSLVEFAEPSCVSNRVEMTWEYPFSFEHAEDNHVAKMGGAIELENGNLLVATGTRNSYFELTREGEIVWEYSLRRMDTTAKSFVPVAAYRASFARTLYPSCFTVEPAGTYHTTANVSKGDIAFRINNEGSSDDRYTLILFNGKNTAIHRQTIDLKAYTSKEVRIPGVKDAAILMITPASAPHSPKMIPAR